MYNKLKTTIYKLLRKSEKWTQTDMIYLAKGGSWMTFGKIISTITGIFLAVLYANFLSKEEYATYKYLLSMASFFAILTLPGLETSLTRSIAKGYEGSIKEVVNTRLKWSLLGSVISICIGIYYYINSNTVLSVGFLIIALTAPFINSLSISPYLQGKKLWKYSTVLNITKNIITFIAIVLSVLLYPNALALLLALYFATSILQIIYYNFTLKRYKPNQKKDDECIKLGKHLSVMSVMSIIAENIDKILIWKLLGATELAIYSFATVPIMHIQNFLKSTSILAFPKIAQQDIGVIKKTLLTKVFKFMCILLIPVGVYIILAPLFFKYIFPQYVESIFYSQLFAFTILFFPQRLIAQSILAASKTKYLYLIQIILPAIKILSFTFLIPFFMINGAIISALVSLLFSFFVLIFFFRKI